MSAYAYVHVCTYVSVCLFVRVCAFALAYSGSSDAGSMLLWQHSLCPVFTVV